MLPLSVVIITRNEENNITDCIRSALPLSDDLIVVDSGSMDSTQQKVRATAARLFTVNWQGYGHSRNFGALQARHDWILALDADERLTPELIRSIKNIRAPRANQILRFRRQNYIAQKKIRFGAPGFDKVTRIYNRNFCQWDTSLVHEKLQGNQLDTRFIAGKLDHFCFDSLKAYRMKMDYYAQLSAEKYLLEDQRRSASKKFFSSLFNAAKSYIFQLGFLEGRKGWAVARIIARYSWTKYSYLEQLQQELRKESPGVFKKKIEPASN